VGKPLPDLKDVKINLPAADLTGKMLLVCFLDIEQKPSRDYLKQVNTMANNLGQQNVVVVAVQASKMDENSLSDWCEKYRISVPVGILQYCGIADALQSHCFAAEIDFSGVDARIDLDTIAVFSLIDTFLNGRKGRPGTQARVEITPVELVDIKSLNPGIIKDVRNVDVRRVTILPTDEVQGRSIIAQERILKGYTFGVEERQMLGRPERFIRRGSAGPEKPALVLAHRHKIQRETVGADRRMKIPRRAVDLGQIGRIAESRFLVRPGRHPYVIAALSSGDIGPRKEDRQLIRSQ